MILCCVLYIHIQQIMNESQFEGFITIGFYFHNIASNIYIERQLLLVLKWN